MVANINALSAPGKSQEYSIGKVHHDQGTEFEGATRQYLDDMQIINERTETDRHTANAIVEQRNKSLAITAACNNFIALGANDSIIAVLHGEGIRWSCQLINNSSITQHQKENNITAYHEQTGRDSPLVAKQIYTWGTLCYGFIRKDNREHKLGNRAFQGIWVGLDKVIADAHI